MKTKISFWVGVVLLAIGAIGLLFKRVSQDDSSLLIAGAILVGLSSSRS
ncbi:MAG: hypothetical protein P1U85_03505 [Verrucomicrobiales bacterium]|nr:hypothetical protein [Verrucomicrobiales bacterium]